MRYDDEFKSTPTSDTSLNETNLGSSARHVYLYERVNRMISDMLDKGQLKPGDKLPSVRKLSKQLDISSATVIHAYSIMESQGFIEAKPRSGFVVSLQPSLNVAQPAKSKPSLLSKKVTIHDIVVLIAEIANDPDYVPLGAATLSQDLVPVKELKSILRQGLKNANEWSFFYEFVPGNKHLLEQLAKQSIKWGCRLTPDDFVITCGAMEALEIALRTVARPGDIIAVESPTFYPILQTLENLGMYALEIPTDPQVGIDLDVLETVLTNEPVKACMLIPNFNNPLGYLMPESHKRRLVSMVSKHSIPIIEDDIYADLYFGSVRPLPLKAYDEDGSVMLCSSVSKTLASGFRIGWVSPGRFMADVKRLKYATNVAAPTLAQQAVAECFRSGLYDRHTQTLRRLFKTQMPRYVEAIANYFPEGTKISQPQGGFLFWVELPEGYDSIKLYKAAIEEGISIAPGPMFSATGDYRNCFRLCGGHLWTPPIEDSLKRLGAMLKTQ